MTSNNKGTVGKPVEKSKKFFSSPSALTYGMEIVLIFVEVVALDRRIT